MTIWPPTEPASREIRSPLYYDAVLWAVEKGITTGLGDTGTFGVEGTCNRAQVVTFLNRAFAK